ncbi:MAG: TIGR01906 family membrane protein, partial [Lachnospiraceae bacterium]|nr:TIGR01906 family membrane protein [Lachnospiraceae bacterium]
MKTFFKPVISIFIALLMMLVSIAFATTAVLYFRPLYYSMIGDFTGKLNLTYTEIKENYDALIDYNSFLGPDKLSFPHLPSSENALTHFEEVKAIFLSFQIVMIIGIILLLVLIPLYKKLYKSYEYRLIGGIFTIFLPSAIALFIYANFNMVFITFHRLVFSNDYWIFDYKKDPIILFLPEKFFM